MTAKQRTKLISEIRTDFQIPPWQSDETIGRAVDRCYDRLCFLHGGGFRRIRRPAGKRIAGKRGVLHTVPPL